MLLGYNVTANGNHSISFSAYLEMLKRFLSGLSEDWQSEKLALNPAEGATEFAAGMQSHGTGEVSLPSLTV